MDIVLAALEQYCQMSGLVDVRNFEFWGREQDRVIWGQGYSSYSPLPPQLSPHPQANNSKAKNGSRSPSRCFPVLTFGWTVSFLVFIFLSIFYSLFIGYLLCARVGGMIQIWPRICPWGAHFSLSFLEVSLAFLWAQQCFERYICLYPTIEY